MTSYLVVVRRQASRVASISGPASQAGSRRTLCHAHLAQSSNVSTRASCPRSAENRALLPPVPSRRREVRFNSTSASVADPIDSEAAEEAAQKAKAARKAQWKRSTSSTSFVDSLSLAVQAGTGGDGCVSFSRAKYVPYGPPSGGGGGRGGDIYIRAVSDMRSLARVPSRAEGGMGGHGKGEWNVGLRGRDIVLKVPVGTVVTVEKIPDDDQDEMDTQRILRSEYEDDLLRRFWRKLKRGRARSPRLKPDPPRSEAAEEEEQEEDVELSHAAQRRQQMKAENELAKEAAMKRNRRDAMWRHYPGGTAASGGGGAPASAQGVIEESDTDIASLRKEFTAAEERLAVTLFKQREEEDKQAREAQRSRAPVSRPGSQDADVLQGTWTIDLDTPTPLDSPGVQLARGGSGGFGNPFFLSTGSISRSPKLATRGGFGERARVCLELKSPADIGLVGFPNAGKSTLLQALTSAGRAGGSAAKVGGYEFTTLSPNVGVMRLGEEGALLGTGSGSILETRPTALTASAASAPSAGYTSAAEREQREAARLTLADLPGLIEGASDNRGLGHLFLRHAERCRALFYVVDVSEGKNKPWEEVRVLHDELEAYREGLSKRCVAVVANKCDALGPASSASPAHADNKDGATAPARSTATEARAKLQRLSSEVAATHEGRVLPILPVSAMHRLGVQVVGAEMRRAVEAARAEEEAKDGSEYKWDAHAAEQVAEQEREQQ